MQRTAIVIGLCVLSLSACEREPQNYQEQAKSVPGEVTTQSQPMQQAPQAHQDNSLLYGIMGYMLGSTMGRSGSSEIHHYHETIREVDNGKKAQSPVAKLSHREVENRVPVAGDSHKPNTPVAAPVGRTAGSTSGGTSQSSRSVSSSSPRSTSSFSGGGGRSGGGRGTR